MIKIYCDNCLKEIIEPMGFDADIYNVDGDNHEHYALDLCPECHKMFRDFIRATNVQPSINPFG